MGRPRRRAKQAAQAAEVIVKITGPSAKIATAMATMAVAMPTAIAKPSMRGVLEMFIAFYNIARRDMHAPLEALCARGSRSSLDVRKKSCPEAAFLGVGADRLKQRRALATRGMGTFDRRLSVADRSRRVTGIAPCVEPSASSSRPS